MSKLLFFILLCIPILGYAQHPIVPLQPITRDSKESDPDVPVRALVLQPNPRFTAPLRTLPDPDSGVNTLEENFDPLKLQKKINSENKKLEKISGELTKKQALLNNLLREKNVNVMDKAGVDKVRKETLLLALDEAIKKKSLENLQHSLLRFTNQYFLNPNLTSSLISDNQAQYYKLNNVIKSQLSDLRHFINASYLEVDANSILYNIRKEPDLLDEKIKTFSPEGAHFYFIIIKTKKLLALQDETAQQLDHLREYEKWRRDAPAILVLKWTIRSTSAPLRFVNMKMVSERKRIIRDLIELVKSPGTTVDEFNVMDIAEDIALSPLHDAPVTKEEKERKRKGEKKMEKILALLAQEKALRSSPLHLLFYEVNRTIHQLDNKLKELDPYSTFDTTPYFLKIIYYPSLENLPGTTPGT